MQLKIIHFTPHLNGGLGNVLFSLMHYFNIETAGEYAIHHIFLYGSDAKASLPLELRDFVITGIQLSDITEVLDNYDIIQIEYWNHPLIYKLLTSGVLDDFNVIACAHIQGEHLPQIITENSIKYFNKVLLTGLGTKSIVDQAKIPIDKPHEIRFPINFNRLFRKDRQSPSRIDKPIIGYLGTLSYSKLDTSFLEICSRFKETAKFLVAGEDINNELEREATAHYPDLKIEFLGKIETVSHFFQRINVFIYPLQKNHYGTGELALIEALYSQVPVVAYNNLSERRLIDDGHTGLLAGSKEEMIEKINWVLNNPGYGRQLGINARKAVLSGYSRNACFMNIHEIYSSVAVQFPSVRKNSATTFLRRYPLDSVSYGEGVQLLLESLAGPTQAADAILKYVNAVRKGDEIEIQCSSADLRMLLEEHPSLTAERKGGIGHYRYVFPEDRDLLVISDFIQQNNLLIRGEEGH